MGEEPAKKNSGGQWHELVIRCPEPARDAVCALLHDAGSTGIVEGEDGGITAYFPPSMPADLVASRMRDLLRAVEAAGLPVGGLEVRAGSLPDRDWNETWKESFAPIDVEENIVILPPWLAEHYGGGKFPIYIDPGMAFGTGHHGTTRDCMRAVSLCASLLPERGPVLDVGTGTGVLAIHAVLAGFGPALALDLDPAAVEAARRNAVLNGVDDRVEVREGGLDAADGGSYALITANLLLNILVEYLPRFRNLLRPGGLMVLSGILSGQEGGLRAAVGDNGLAVREVLATEDWRTLLVSP